MRDLADFGNALKDSNDGACFSCLLFSSLTVISYRALLPPTLPLYDTRLEQNLLQIVEPYSVIGGVCPAAG